MRTVALAVLLGLALSPRAAVAAAQDATGFPRPDISNVGTGRVKVKADRADVTVAVVTHGESAPGAGRQNAERMSQVVAALKRLGIPDSMMSTNGYSVTADEYDDRRPRPAPGVPQSYLARNTVHVVLERLGDLGRTIDTALAAGATEISGVSFGASDTRVARQRAIALAVVAARADAEAAATAAGGKLGPILDIQVDLGASSVFMRSMSLDEVVVSGYAAATPVIPVELTVTASARVRSVMLRGQ